MDVIDLHWYPEAQGGGVRITENNNSAAVVAARVQAPRRCGTRPTPKRAGSASGARGLARPAIRARSSCCRACSATSTTSSRARRSPSPNTTTAARITSPARSPRPTCSAVFGREDVFRRDLLEPDGDAELAVRRRRVQDVSRLRRRGRPVRRYVRRRRHTSNIAQSSIYASVDSTDPNRMVVVAINRTGSDVRRASR